MKRALLRIEDVVSVENLHWATWRAARGKRDRSEVREFLRDLPQEIAALRAEALAGSLDLRPAAGFQIHDPKPRWIEAPPFRERVLHHALMRHVGPLLDRALVADTFACREGKGALRAVRRAQHFLRRSPWFVQVDVRHYFASIDIERMRALLTRRIRGGSVLGLCDQVLAAHSREGRGLAIGALTSQHFANAYLGSLDRWLSNDPRVRGMVRYMDDAVWWTGSRRQALATLREAGSLVEGKLGLELKASLVQRSTCGLTLCGFRVHRRRLRLTQRRKRRYTAHRHRLENQWRRGEISERKLQASFSSVLETTAHAQAAGWRRNQLALHPSPEV